MQGIVETMASRPVVLVTGAARRIGREIALDLARHGFDVAVHYRSSHEDAEATAAQARALGARTQVFCADLADEAAARSLVPAVAAHFKRIDAVVNNASSFEYDDAADFSYAMLARQMQANAAPAIVLANALHAHLSAPRPAEAGRPPRGSSKVAKPHLLESGCSETGCVVNLLDQKLWNLNPDYFSYTLSKAALEAATTMLAMALAPMVRVCGVAPGVTLLSGEMSEGEFEHAHRLTPLQRSSTPLDVARSVRFLIESPAVTGTTLLVDGGQHLGAQARDVMFLARSGGTPRPD
jgi:NAD(P)-dependent dehydrogenase (short-subunit alcohol dehydrogenase family)